MASTIFLFALLGAGTGALYALASIGMVLTFRGSGVVNFASGAMGMAGTFVYWELHDRLGWPFFAAVVMGVGTSALLGWLTHILMTPLRQASNLTKIVVTLAVLVVLEGAIGLKYPTTNTYTVVPELPTGPVNVLGANVGRDRLLILGITVILTGIVFVIYRYTRFGLATSAVAENRDALTTLGWSSNTIAGLNWALGAGLSGLAGILLAPIVGLSVTLSTILLLPSIAAAVIGNLTSFPLTLAGGLGIGILQSEIQRYVTLQGATDAVPFAAILIVVVLRGRSLPLRSELAQRLPIVTNGEIPWKRVVTWTFIVCALMFILPSDWVSAVTFTILGAVLLESIVVITGFAGQISLAQWAIAGLGALVVAWLRDLGVPFELAIPIAILSALPVGVVVGSAALRARGISLAIATLAFGVCIVSLILQNFSLNGGPNGLNVGNFSLFGIALDTATPGHARRFGVFCIIVFVLVAVAIANTRRGKSGRRLLAVRANERAAASLGLNVIGIKLSAFCYGAMIAALAGIMGIVEFANATFTNFDVFTSIQLIDYAIVGGVGFVTGPIIGGQGEPGGVGSQALSYFSSSSQQYVTLIFGVLALVVILQAPNGMAKFQSTMHQKNLVKFRKLFRRPPKAARLPIRLPVDVPQPSRVEAAFVQVENISVTFGAVRAVDGVSLEIRAGEVLGVIGSNGAGKTTLIDALTGFITLASGTIRLDGEDVAKLSARDRARKGFGRSFQSLELFEDISVYENLLVACETRDLLSWATDLVHPGKPKLSEAAQIAVHELGLEHALEAMPSEISYGTRRLVVIARAIAARPRVLLLDEPAAGLDVQERDELVRIIRRLAEDWGIAVLLIEHDVALVARVADRMIALDFGQLIAQGSPDEVRLNPRVIASYLGVDEDAVASAESAPELSEVVAAGSTDAVSPA
jgi:ABC-type branched-subunit amino acid transport system ATPase component/branched-subunit amino acid ABC-type transport system permease component